MVLTLAPELDQLTWFGRGPHETYADRKAGARLGRWRQPVADQLYPYPFPQESGNRTDVRWASVTDTAGFGLLATGDGLFETSALPYVAADLATATHHHELRPRPETTWHLDHRQSGLGNASCGPGVLEPYLVPAEPVTFSFTLRPLV
ncbi:hypothetical protein BH24ACT3_BH24ACT3_12330 [soil metagenome]